MEQRRLGRTDIKASVLGFGGSEIGYERASGRSVARLLGSALDAGLNVIDTAECYEESETLIGRAIGDRRSECYLFTKCGHPRGWGVGRHVIGSNYFFYSQDPWGSFTEYSYDIDFIGADADWPEADHPPDGKSLPRPPAADHRA